MSLGLALAALHLQQMTTKRIQQAQASAAEPKGNEKSKYADYHKVSEIPPFHMGDTITCEDREILITGFCEDSYGNFLIEGERIYRTERR